MTKKSYFKTKPKSQDENRAAIKAMPAYRADEPFTAADVAAAIGKTHSCASHLLRQMVADMELSQRPGDNEMLYSRPATLMRRPLVRRANGIQIGRYYGPTEAMA